MAVYNLSNLFILLHHPGSVCFSTRALSCCSLSLVVLGCASPSSPTYKPLLAASVVEGCGVCVSSLTF